MEERELYRAGKGNWNAFPFPAETVLKQAERWRDVLAGIERPWLCWNVNEAWCLVQQRLVESVGWTPVVGFDPRAGRPEIIDSAVVLDFNEGFDFPALHMVFPLEFVFVFAPRLAFWHSDLLVRPERMQKIVAIFEGLADGEMAAVDDRGSFLSRLRGHVPRYWELIGCTTRAASRDQFERGSGWWRHIADHPNCPENERESRKRYGYDHGVGIYYWQKQYGGRVRPIPESWVAEGHCTRIRNPHYEPQSPNDERRDLSKDLVHNYDLVEVCRRLGLDDFLDASS